MHSRHLGLVVLLGAAAACSSGTPVLETGTAPATSIATAPDRFLDSSGSRIRYREAGRGTPVVLIHGYAGRLEHMAPLADSLAATHRVVAFDVRGFGQSLKSPHPATFGRRLADDVVRLLDHLRIDRAHLVGHSMGALISANVAVRSPSRVRSVTLIGGPFWPDSARFDAETRSWADDLAEGRGLVNFALWLFPGMPRATAEGMDRQILAANDMPTMIAVMRSMPALAVQGGGSRPVPAFIIVGSADPLQPWTDTLAAHWRGARALTVQGANHVDIIGRPELLAGIRDLAR